MSDINFKTGWLKDPADNQKFAPKTTTNQVLTGDGNRLTDELANIKADADTKLDEAKTFATNEVTNLSQSIEKGYVIPDVANAAIYDSNRKAIHTTYETKADAAQKDTTLRYDLSEGKLVPSNAYLAANAVCDEKGRDITSTYETKVDASNKYIESKAHTDTEVAKKAALGTDGFFTSKRDFENGTLITTNIDYSVDGGESWLLEIKGNSYTSKIPFDLKLQGYIYKTDSDSMINYGGISNGFFFDDIVAFCYNTQLCFWFPKIAYWHGFDVRVTKLNTATAENANCVVSVTDEAKPENITKEVNFKGYIRQSITSENIAYQNVAYANTAGAANTANSATNANYASKATHDDQGNNIITTYATKSEAQGYANTVKNDLLNGAGGAYDTLKELGELIDTNVDAIDALETVAASKESKEDAAAKLREAKNEVAALSQAIVGGEITANKAISADKATKDASGNIITSTYETKADASQKLIEAKEYTETLKNNLTTGAVIPLISGKSDYAERDLSGNVITSTYETKSDATSKYNELNTKVEKATPFVAAYNQTSFNDIKAAYDLGRPIQVYREFELPAAGAYDADDNMIYSWQELLDMDVEYQELDGMNEDGTNNWVTKTGKCLQVEDGILKSIVTYSSSTHSYTNHSANALSGASKLIISNDVTSIGSEGLAAFNIKEIILPSTVTTIEEYAFAYIYEYYDWDDYYSTIYIPYSVSSISFKAFYHSYVSLKYEGTETEFSSIASIRDFNTNTYSFYYTCRVSLLNNPILGQLISALDNKFIFTAHEASGEVEYECSKNYGWSTRNIQMMKLGDAVFKYDYTNQRIVISFPEEGAVG